MGARCSGSTSVSKTEGAGSIPAAPASPRYSMEPGYCGTCGTINPADWMECGGEHCFWVFREFTIEEPRRAA